MGKRLAISFEPEFWNGTPEGTDWRSEWKSKIYQLKQMWMLSVRRRKKNPKADVDFSARDVIQTPPPPPPPRRKAAVQRSANTTYGTLTYLLCVLKKALMKQLVQRCGREKRGGVRIQVDVRVGGGSEKSPQICVRDPQKRGNSKWECHKKWWRKHQALRGEKGFHTVSLDCSFLFRPPSPPTAHHHQVYQPSYHGSSRREALQRASRC